MQTVFTRPRFKQDPTTSPQEYTMLICRLVVKLDDLQYSFSDSAIWHFCGTAHKSPCHLDITKDHWQPYWTPGNGHLVSCLVREGQMSCRFLCNRCPFIEWMEKVDRNHCSPFNCCSWLSSGLWLIADAAANQFQWTEKVPPHFFSSLDPIVNASCKNCRVGSP